MLTATYLHYAPKLARAIAGGLTRGTHRTALDSPFELDDIVQETFIRAFSPNARRAYDGTRPFFRYLAAIAHNLLIDRGRRLSRRREHASAAQRLGATRPTADASPEANAMVGQLHRLYRAFVDGLQPSDRRIWSLRVEQGHTRRAVEDATGITAMQVRTRESHLRRDLISRLDAAGYGPDLDNLGLAKLLALVI